MDTYVEELHDKWISDRNRLAHQCLVIMLAALDPREDLFDLRIATHKVQSEQPVVEILTTMQAEIVREGMGAYIEDMTQRTETYVESVGTGSKVESLDINGGSYLDIDNCDWAWEAAKMGRLLIEAWIAEQRKVDGESQQANEILREWFGDRIKAATEPPSDAK